MKSAITLALLSVVQLLLVACASAPATPSAEDDARLAKAERIANQADMHSRAGQSR